MINGHDHGVHGEQLANTLTPESNPEEVRKTLAQLAFSDPLFVERVLLIVKAKTRLPLPALRKTCQQIRREATFGGAQNAPSVLINTPSSSPQMVPTRGPEFVPNSAPQLVPTRGPQNVPSGGPQFVPNGGVQMVPAGGARVAGRR